MKFFTFLFVICTGLFSSDRFSEFEWAQEKWTRKELEEKLGRYQQKDGRIGSFFTLTDEALTLYDAPETERSRSVDFCLRLVKGKRVSSKREKQKSLVGVKIALDPGHLGGPYARLGERYIDHPPSLERKQGSQFDEGTVSFLTALYLKILLEKEGAIVMITRDQIGQCVYRESFFDWLKKNPHLWSGQVSLSNLFRRFYNPLDLRARAEKINAFKPDLSVVLHYNSHHVEEEYSSNNCVSSKNYNLVFVPGSFCRNELASEDSRYEFMRLLVTRDLDESRRLSRCILDAFYRKLAVPVVENSDGVAYLDKVCLAVEKGIYARNLALTRLIHGPVCYGETLIQNNIDECLNLTRKDFVIGGIECSSRIKEVAEAYFEGIKRYVLP